MNLSLRFCLISLTIVFSACSSSSSESSISYSNDAAFTKPDKTTKVCPTTYKLAVARDRPSQTRGLMFVKESEMAFNQGMLFIFPDIAPRTFWMHNTFLSLDMIFLDEGLRVQGILSKVPPLNDDPRSVPDIKSKYVLELKGGEIARCGVTAGDYLQISLPS